MNDAVAWSNKKVQRLGKRLVASATPDEADFDQLDLLLAAYDEALLSAATLVEERLDIRLTSRLKVTGTIIEKLHRHGGWFLPKMQDLAGIRIVGEFNRNGQDQLVEQLRDLFASDDVDQSPEVVDRRKDPRQGYRAVHLVVHHIGLPVEIQVRTKWQHEWANMFEKMADLLGRGIRYGEPPDEFLNEIEASVIGKVSSMYQEHPDAVDVLHHFAEQHDLERDLVGNALRLAESIAIYEKLELKSEALLKDVEGKNWWRRVRMYVRRKDLERLFRIQSKRLAVRVQKLHGYAVRLGNSRTVKEGIFASIERACNGNVDEMAALLIATSPGRR